jgi:hypothetical protein
MRRLVLWVLAVSLMSSFAVAQSTSGYKLKVRTFSELANEQRRLVLGYCRADFDGARLLTDGFEKMRPYVSYRTNPEFDSFIVVSRFEIPLPEQPGDVVSAIYKVVGNWDKHGGWAPENSSDAVQFRIIEREGELMINEIEPGQPRVSVRTALAYLKRQLPSASSDVERGMMQKGIDALSALIAPPSTASSAPVPASRP